MLDVAKGILYLHVGGPEPVLHLDLKPDNVLFDGKVWQLIDFGLARKIGELKQSGKTHHSTQRIFGTAGFIATEFSDSGHMSTACDMYSFGVLILVVLTGAKPYASGEHLRDTVEDALDDVSRSEPMPAAVRALQTRSCLWSFPHGDDAFKALLRLGVSCCQVRKKKRPGFPEVSIHPSTQSSIYPPIPPIHLPIHASIGGGAPRESPR
jgi:serine/threonine protein kinase